MQQPVYDPRSMQAMTGVTVPYRCQYLPCPAPARPQVYVFSSSAVDGDGAVAPDKERGLGGVAEEGEGEAEAADGMEGVEGAGARREA